MNNEKHSFKRLFCLLGLIIILFNCSKVSKHTIALTEMKTISACITIFLAENNRFPFQNEYFDVLIPIAAELNYNPEKLFYDPWGKKYCYILHRDRIGNVMKFNLMSFGKDKRPGGIRENTDITLYE